MIDLYVVATAAHPSATAAHCVGARAESSTPCKSVMQIISSATATVSKRKISVRIVVCIFIAIHVIASTSNRDR
eukprot:3375268-Rhodomonas_salina.1